MPKTPRNKELNSLLCTLCSTKHPKTSKLHMDHLLLLYTCTEIVLYYLFVEAYTNFKRFGWVCVKIKGSEFLATSVSERNLWQKVTECSSHSSLCTHFLLFAECIYVQTPAFVSVSMWVSNIICGTKPVDTLLVTVGPILVHRQNMMAAVGISTLFIGTRHYN